MGLLLDCSFLSTVELRTAVPPIQTSMSCWCLGLWVRRNKWEQERRAGRSERGERWILKGSMRFSGGRKEIWESPWRGCWKGRGKQAETQIDPSFFKKTKQKQNKSNSSSPFAEGEAGAAIRRDWERWELVFVHLFSETGGTGRQPMRQPEEGISKGLNVRPPWPKRTIRLRSSNEAASLETGLLPHHLPLHLHRQGSPPNQPEQSKTTTRVTVSFQHVLLQERRTAVSAET